MHIDDDDDDDDGDGDGDETIGSNFIVIGFERRSGS